jgi:hypothetical protein
MSEWHDMQKEPNTKWRDLLKTKQAKTRRLSELSKIEQNRLAKLNAMLDELRRGKNVQNRQLQTWLSADEYEQIAAEWDTQKHFRKELKDKPSELNLYEDKLKVAIMVRNRSEYTKFHFVSDNHRNQSFLISKGQFCAC